MEKGKDGDIGTLYGSAIKKARSWRETEIL
jgi:hypothetical protein